MVKIKNALINPVDQLLEQQFDTWQSIPGRLIVVILDGLDEVPSDQFSIMVTHIENFMEKYPFIKLIFSCRKLFYYNHRLDEKLKTVRCYLLESLRYHQTMSFLEQQLGESKTDFWSRISGLDLEQFLAYLFISLIW